jgi:UDP-glucose 4-epimerase
MRKNVEKYLIIGGAGFIGSHVAKNLIRNKPNSKIVIYDNFSSGTAEHLREIEGKLEIVEADIKDRERLTTAMRGIDVVYQFAANPDIAKAVKQPDIDFWEGTYLVNNILEAMRENNVKRIIYSSGSGVYGETGQELVSEDYSPMRPISTYGASKLGCEALICSYTSMFGIAATIFRFANVVGPKQTHGVGYDFIRRLIKNPKRLEILGDGNQNKSYIYIDDIVSAIDMALEKEHGYFNIYNVSSGDLISVKNIAEIACHILQLEEVEFVYTGGDRGWKGDVPTIRLDSTKIESLGWAPVYSSSEAIKKSMEAMAKELLLLKNV